MKRFRIIIIILVAFLAGFLIRGGRVTQEKTKAPDTATGQSGQQQWWTCSMHPQIRQPKPGKCPICFMDLIPVSQENPQAAEREISFSNEALKLMEIETTPVERKFVEAQIYMVGKAD